MAITQFVEDHEQPNSFTTNWDKHVDTGLIEHISHFIIFVIINFSRTFAFFNKNAKSLKSLSKSYFIFEMILKSSNRWVENFKILEVGKPKAWNPTLQINFISFGQICWLKVAMGIFNPRLNISGPNAS